MRALAPERSKRFTTAEEFRLALSDAIAEAAPHTDAARVSELMHAIYNKAIAEEAAEHERFLKEVLPAFRAAAIPIPTRIRTPPPLPAAQRTVAGSVRASVARATRMAAQAMAIGGSDPEARKQAKREAALKVLAELADAVGENETATSRK
jgi:vesicle coat complex subunit